MYIYLQQYVYTNVELTRQILCKTLIKKVKNMYRLTKINTINEIKNKIKYKKIKNNNDNNNNIIYRKKKLLTDYYYF